MILLKSLIIIFITILLYERELIAVRERAASQ